MGGGVGLGELGAAKPWGGVQGPLPHAHAELSAFLLFQPLASPLRGSERSPASRAGKASERRAAEEAAASWAALHPERPPLGWARTSAPTHACTHSHLQRVLWESLRTPFKPQSLPYRSPLSPEPQAGTPGSNVPTPPGTWLSRSPPGRGRAGPAATSRSPPSARAPRNPRNPPMGHRLPLPPRPAAPSPALRAAQRRIPAQ